jgi:protein TonB
MSSNRTVSIVVVALLHVVLGYALISGFAVQAVKEAVEDLQTFDVVEEEPPPPPEETPPPENVPESAPPVVSPPPLVRTNIPPPPAVTTTDVAPPAAPITPTAPTAPPAPPAPPPPPPPPAPPQVSQAAKARGSLPGLFSTDDYPQDAIRNEQQGTTAVRLTVGTDGRVSGCTVTQSSGSSSLDAATCRIIRSRARYTPARDQNGNPISDSDTARIRWQLPED